MSLLAYLNVVSWAPCTFSLCGINLLFPNGLKSSAGDENENVPLRHGAVGPILFPVIHEFDDPHHPHDP